MPTMRATKAIVVMIAITDIISHTTGAIKANNNSDNNSNRNHTHTHTM